MYFIPSRLHAVIDYIVGIALIAAPWVLGFADSSANNATPDSWATWSAVGVGVVILASSLMTSYEFSLIKAIPFSTHLIVDMAAGLFLIGSPWLFGFASYVYLPHVIVGVVEIVVALATVRSFSTGRSLPRMQTASVMH